MRLLKDESTGRLIYCPEYAIGRYLVRGWEDVTGEIPERPFHCQWCAWFHMPDYPQRDKDRQRALFALMSHGVTF